MQTRIVREKLKPDEVRTVVLDEFGDIEVKKKMRAIIETLLLDPNETIQR